MGRRGLGGLGGLGGLRGGREGGRRLSGAVGEEAGKDTVGFVSSFFPVLSSFFGLWATFWFWFWLLEGG